MNSPFKKRRLMSRSEYRMFKFVEDFLVKERRGYRACPQTNLGEVLESPNRDGFSSINSKRADILIIDRGGWPVLAIEVQGGGHFQGTAAARDAVKKEALRRAGVGYMEVTEADSQERICSRLREHLGLGKLTPASPSDTAVAGFGRRNPVPGEQDRPYRLRSV